MALSRILSERRNEEPDGESELWLRVVEVASGKVVKAVAIYRECDLDSEFTTPCESGEPISKKASARYRAQIYAKFGQPTGGRAGKLMAKPGSTHAGAEQISTSAGVSQTWQVGKVRVTTRLTTSGKLPDAFEWKAVAVTMSVLLEGPWGRCEGKGRFSVSPGSVDGWSNRIEWPSFGGESMNLAPKGRAVAMVLGNRPVVIKLKPTASGKPAANGK